MTRLKRWRVWLICCERDDGVYLAETWDEAEAFREAYTSGYAVDQHGYSGTEWGHKRAGVIERIDADAKVGA